jgi:hypothetical protein
MSIRYNEDLDPNQGPGFGCFVTQAILFAVILLLIPVGLFTFGWPVWLLTTLLLVDMVLLFFVSMRRSPRAWPNARGGAGAAAHRDDRGRGAE